MSTQLNPYLNFKDQAREAMEFYESVFGGDLKLQTFKEFHASKGPSEDNKIMHSSLVINNGMTLMAADTPNSMDFKPASGFGISLNGEDETELRGYWDKLSDGGNISMPLEKASWGDTFGMCIDKFGICWLVNITNPDANIV